MVIFLGNTNSGDQNFLNPFIFHRDTSHYMVLKKIGVTSSGPFASILTNTPVKFLSEKIVISTEVVYYNHQGILFNFGNNVNSIFPSLYDMP